MGNIVLLDELTINKIAAGEVIERPASVIKEMLENSIDAGAKNITVEIKNGGISFIRITDNGKGIAKDDVEIAFERHATSKIRSADDLIQVKSMGFRGEALASIAAIANVELVSRTEFEEIGTRIVVEGGDVLSLDEIGCSKGTTITVRNLFYNTPVRYKFLKKDFTESGYIEDVITRISLIHPEVAIKFINTGKTVIQTSGNGELKGVIYNIFGKDVATNLENVNYEYEYIKIKGVTGTKEIARSNRSNQILFVNQRYVKDKTLTSAIDQAFKGMYPMGKFPFLVLNIEMPPSKVDVNVHPAKLEVRFEEENIIFKAMYHAIKDTLLSPNDTDKKQTIYDFKDNNKNVLNQDNQEIKENNNNISIQENQETKENSNIFSMQENQETKTSEPTIENNKQEMNDAFMEMKDIKPEEMDVIEQLKSIQEALKREVEKNPNLQLTDEYKNMEQKYKETVQIPLEQKVEITEQSINEKLNKELLTNIEEEQVPKLLREQKESFIPIMFEDSNINTEQTKEPEEIKENNQNVQDNQEIKENNQNVQDNQEIKENNQKVQEIEEVKEKNQNIQEIEEVKENNQNIQEIEEVKEENQNMQENEEIKDENQNIQENEQMENKITQEREEIKIVEQADKLEEKTPLSFNEMYKKLFGKEPYGGRKVEIPEDKKENKENNFYTIDANMEDTNISLFEGEESNNKIQYKFIGMAFDKYIVLEIENELYIMDEKSAQERIIYEKLKVNFFEDNQKTSQLLLLPDIIALTHKQMDIAKDNFYLFRKAGFILEEFGENTIKLSGVPEICIDLNTEELFKETIEEIDKVARNAIQEREEKFLATIANRVATREKTRNTKEEIDEIMDNLFEFSNPFTSPQGKPIVIKMTRYEIERKFSRK